MSRGLIVIISGPAGSGKGTVIAELMKDRERFFYSVSATTRKPRAQERDGINYLFVSREQFEKKIAENDMLEYAEYVGNYYGTPLSPMLRAQNAGKHVILEIETQGALNVKKKIPDAVAIMLLPPDGKTLRERLEGRGTETPDVIERRMKVAHDEVGLLDFYDYVVINENERPQTAAEKINGIINAELLKTSRNLDIKENYFV